MKNIFYLALLTLLIAGGCKTEENDNPIPIYGYRLLELAFSYDSTVYESVSFSYNSDKVSGWMGVNPENNEYMVDAVYPNDNIAEFIISVLRNGTWSVDEKVVYTFAHNRIHFRDNYSFVDNEFVLSHKSIYQHNSDGNIIEKMDSYFVENQEILSYKQTFSFNGNLLANSYYFNYNDESWSETLRIVYQYDIDVLVSSITSAFSNNSWNEFYKNEFYYNGENVTKIMYYNSSGDVWELNTIISYTYDNKGNMILTEESSHSGSTLYIANYTYEAKLGNLSIFDFDSEYGFPNPIYKHDLNVINKSNFYKVE